MPNLLSLLRGLMEDFTFSLLLSRELLACIYQLGNLGSPEASRNYIRDQFQRTAWEETFEP